MTIVVDTEACIAGWGPCNESYGFSHSCKKREGHGGFHICAICGDRRKLPDYPTEIRRLLDESVERGPRDGGFRPTVADYLEDSDETC